MTVDFARRSVAEAKVDHQHLFGELSENPQSSTVTPSSANKLHHRKFTSQEHYTPVYDGTLSDMQPLDVLVVNSVTEFYTYQKALMDYLRSLAEEMNISAHAHQHDMMIYMQFLMLESARQAITQLIEFEPNREESLINILCSGIVLFEYLINLPDFFNDYHGERLRTRVPVYNQIVPSVCNKAMNAEEHANWERARTTANELMRRYTLFLANVSRNDRAQLDWQATPPSSA